MSLWDRIGSLVISKRVTPPVPAGRTVFVPDADEVLAGELLPPLEDLPPEAGWSFFLQYDGGSISARRVTIKKLSVEKLRVLRIMGFCHEREALREFRVDRVREAIDYATGEVLTGDGLEAFLLDRLEHLPEVRVSAMIRILVFMAHCDGSSAAEEWDAIDRAIVRIARALMHDDRGVERMLLEARRQSPDGADFMRALNYLKKNRMPRRVHDELKRGIAEVIDADGRHQAEEVEWALIASQLISEFPTSL